jgi:hypothetical protein
MPHFSVQIDEAVAQTIRDNARRLKIPEDAAVARVLAAYHEEFRRFPDGVLRDGCQKLVALLGQIPCLSKFDSSGVDFRYWSVSFEMNIASPIAWPVVQKLGLFLNTQSVEMMLPTVFRPTPSEWPDEPMRWEIAATTPRLDPADVVAWLRDRLPKPLSDTALWMSDDSQ